jgi:hypothetical protein
VVRALDRRAPVDAAVRGNQTHVSRETQLRFSVRYSSEQGCAVALLRVRDPPHHGRNVFHIGFERMRIRDARARSRVSLVLAGVPCAEVERPAVRLATQAQDRAWSARI